jgi:hypothetical protein
MQYSMKSSAALAVAALFCATAATAQPKAEPAQPAQPAKAQPGKPAKPQPAQPAQPARAPGNEGRDNAAEAREAHGKSAEPHGKSGEPHGKSGEPHGKSDEAHAAAPGQNRDEEAKAPGQDDAKAQTRAKRRQDHRGELKRQYGLELLKRPAVLAELKTHAWRMARLERMQNLAEAITNADKRKKTLARLEKLITKEKERHARQMEHLKSQGDTVAASASAEGQGKPANLGKPETSGKPEHAGKPASAGQGKEKNAEKAGGGQ